MAMFRLGIAVFLAGLLAISITSQAAGDASSDRLPPAIERFVEPRLDAVEKSVEAIAEMLRRMQTESMCQRMQTASTGGCRMVKECCLITCCQWGSPGNGRTVVCLEPCCGAYCERLRCD